MALPAVESVARSRRFATAQRERRPRLVALLRSSSATVELRDFGV
ncbi:MAG: hypothetical protein ABIZ81_10820 [Opitutaceae bacterium]